ncbi:MAG TPA: hypothetical protein VHO48_10930, partial [Anaerolineaceae bacterium]|nr:hypothetical protein [Anaerolineaceae bacterium]
MGRGAQIEILPKAVPQVVERTTGPIFLLPSVANLLGRLGCLPPYRVLAGVEEDGRPLLLNLSDPARLPVLIAAEPGSGKTRLLHALVESALRLHSSADLRAV